MNDQNPAPQPAVDENSLIAERRAKLTALRVNIAVMPQRVRIVAEVRRGAVVTVKRARFIPGQLHSGSRHIDTMRRIGRAIRHALRQLRPRFDHRHAQPRLAQPGEMDRQCGAGESPADDDNLLL